MVEGLQRANKKWTVLFILKSALWNDAVITRGCWSAVGARTLNVYHC